jgi:hypothetical protein
MREKRRSCNRLGGAAGYEGACAAPIKASCLPGLGRMSKIYPVKTASSLEVYAKSMGMAHSVVDWIGRAMAPLKDTSDVKERITNDSNHMGCFCQLILCLQQQRKAGPRVKRGATVGEQWV